MDALFQESECMCLWKLVLWGGARSSVVRSALDLESCEWWGLDGTLTWPEPHLALRQGRMQFLSVAFPTRALGRTSISSVQSRWSQMFFISRCAFLIWWRNPNKHTLIPEKQNFYLKNFSGAWLIYNVVLVSSVQKSESVTCKHVSNLSWILFPFRSLWSIEKSSLCYTASSY